jgi:predicted RNase H-like HicB family nuclease
VELKLRTHQSEKIICEDWTMKLYTYVIEKCPGTGLYVGYVPGFPGAHSQAETLEELQQNMQDVIEMLLESA